MWGARFATRRRLRSKASKRASTTAKNAKDSSPGHIGPMCKIGPSWQKPVAMATGGQPRPDGELRLPATFGEPEIRGTPPGLDTSVLDYRKRLQDMFGPPSRDYNVQPADRFNRHSMALPEVRCSFPHGMNIPLPAQALTK